MAQPKDPYTTRTTPQPPTSTPPYVPPTPPAPVPIVKPAPAPAPVTLPQTGGTVTAPYVPPTPRVPTVTKPAAPKTYLPMPIQTQPKVYVNAPANRYYTPMPDADRQTVAARLGVTPPGSLFATPAAPMTSAAPTRANTYSAAGNAPGGGNADWWDEFTRAHNGRTPEDVYYGDVDAALRDKAWAEQFQRTYGRPPSEYDWKASYYSRKYGPSGGGGGGGGSYGSGNAAGATGLPAMWQTLFSTWYTANPQEQAAQDYERFQQTWLARANTLPTTQQADAFLMLFAQYVQNVLGKTLGNATPAEFQTFLDRYLTQTPTPPPTAPLNLGEI